MAVQKINKKKEKHVRYSLKDLCVIIAAITVFCILLLMFMLSIKAVVQLVQLLVYENKAVGTVTVAKYEGGQGVIGSRTQHKYDYYRYVIEFDEIIAGVEKYEEEETDMITVEKHIGDRYIVLFYNDIDRAVLIQYDDVATDNIILLIFLIFVGIVVFVWRKIFKD